MPGRSTPLLTALLIVFAALFDAAQADDAPLQAFFGKYKGSGVTLHPTAPRGLTDRDLDVEIGPAENGFFVAWTTIFRWAFFDEELRRKSARVVFVPSGRPGIFLAQGATERIADGLSWASVTGNVLSVRTLAIQDNGTYVVQNYHRSLTEDGLSLQFLSDGDGQNIRMVHARLKKSQ